MSGRQLALILSLLLFVGCRGGSDFSPEPRPPAGNRLAKPAGWAQAPATLTDAEQRAYRPPVYLHGCQYTLEITPAEELWQGQLAGSERFRALLDIEMDFSGQASLLARAGSGDFLYRGGTIEADGKSSSDREKLLGRSVTLSAWARVPFFPTPDLSHIAGRIASHVMDGTAQKLILSPSGSSDVTGARQNEALWLGPEGRILRYDYQDAVGAHEIRYQWSEASHIGFHRYLLQEVEETIQPWNAEEATTWRVSVSYGIQHGLQMPTMLLVTRRGRSPQDTRAFQFRYDYKEVQTKLLEQANAQLYLPGERLSRLRCRVRMEASSLEEMPRPSSGASVHAAFQLQLDFRDSLRPPDYVARIISMAPNGLGIAPADLQPRLEANLAHLEPAFFVTPGLCEFYSNVVSIKPYGAVSEVSIRDFSSQLPREKSANIRNRKIWIDDALHMLRYEHVEGENASLRWEYSWSEESGTGKHQLQNLVLRRTSVPAVSPTVMRWNFQYENTGGLSLPKEVSVERILPSGQPGLRLLFRLDQYELERRSSQTPAPERGPSKTPLPAAEATQMLTRAEDLVYQPDRYFRSVQFRLRAILSDPDPDMNLPRDLEVEAVFAVEIDFESRNADPFQWRLEGLRAIRPENYQVPEQAKQIFPSVVRVGTMPFFPLHKVSRVAHAADSAEYVNDLWRVRFHPVLHGQPEPPAEAQWARITPEGHLQAFEFQDDLGQNRLEFAWEPCQYLDRVRLRRLEQTTTHREGDLRQQWALEVSYGKRAEWELPVGGSFRARLSEQAKAHHIEFTYVDYALEERDVLRRPSEGPP